MKKYLLIFIASVALSVYSYGQCEGHGPATPFTDDFEDCGTQGWSAGPNAGSAGISTYHSGEYAPEFGNSGYRVYFSYDYEGNPYLTYLEKNVDNPGVLTFGMNKKYSGSSGQDVTAIKVSYGSFMQTMSINNSYNSSFQYYTFDINQRGTGELRLEALPANPSVYGSFWFDNIEVSNYGNTSYNGEHFAIACTDKHIGYEGDDLLVTAIPGLSQLPGFENLIPITKIVNVQVGGDNADLGACIVFKYTPEEVPEGVNIAMLRLFKSEDGGDTWMEVPIDDHDMLAHTISASGIDSFSQWTLAGPTAPPSVPLSNWAILAILIGLGVFVYIKLR